MLGKITETALIIFMLGFGIFFNFGCYILQKDRYEYRKMQEQKGKN